MTCERCGCTDDRACVDELGEACAWVRPGLCSACATEAELSIAFDRYLARADEPNGDDVAGAGLLLDGGPPPLLYDAYGRALR